jgi:hypothetical protein
VRTTQDCDIGQRYRGPPAAVAGDEPEGSGWVFFAAVLLSLAGLWNFLAGVAGIADAHV